MYTTNSNNQNNNSDNNNISSSRRHQTCRFRKRATSNFRFRRRTCVRARSLLAVCGNERPQPVAMSVTVLVLICVYI